MYYNHDASGTVPHCSLPCNDHQADISDKAQERVDNSMPLNCQAGTATGSRAPSFFSDSDVPYRTTSFV